MVLRCLKIYAYAVRAMKAMKREGAWTSQRSRHAAVGAIRSTRSTKASSPSSTPANVVTAGEDSMELTDRGAYIYTYSAVFMLVFAYGQKKKKKREKSSFRRGFENVTKPIDSPSI